DPLRGGGAVPFNLGVALLEAEGGRKRDRLPPAVAPAEIAGEDQHPLVVGLSAQLGFAFDVDDSRLSDKNLRRDSRGPPEGEIPQIDDGESVHLADHRLPRIDGQGSLRDQLADLFLPEIQAAVLLFKRFQYIAAGDEALSGSTGPVARLPDQVGDRAELQGELFLMTGGSRRLLQQRRHAGSIEGEEAFLPAKLPHEAAILERRFIAQVLIGLEINLHFEKRREIFIEGAEEVINQGASDQNHPKTDRNRLRFEDGGGAESVEISEIFDLRLPIFNRALERLP